MHFPPHFKYYLYYALELVLAACSMIALLAVTAGLNCVFNFALAHNWITLKFAKPIFNAIEYYLIIMSVIAFFEMSRASTRILRFELKRFYLKSDEGEGTVGKDAQAKDGRKEGGQ